MRLPDKSWTPRLPCIPNLDRGYWRASTRLYSLTSYEKRKLTVERQRPMPIVYDGIRFDEAFRIDLLVNSKVIGELKSVECLSPLHAKQLLTQLRLGKLKLGLRYQLRRGAS